MSSITYRWTVSIGVFLAISASTQAADWPTWRNNAQRTAVTSEQLAPILHLQWSREMGAITPAWTEDSRIQFDAHYEPVIAGETLFVASSRNDSVTALDLTTGEQKWRFYANGPVRFAPIVSGKNLYFAADDGYFYCLNAANGDLRWKFRAAPNDRKALANGRLSSVWPVRGGPVLADGRIYFTCGVWPFEGTFLYTLDAETGDAVEAPKREIKTLKDLTPQGYLAKNDSRLLIPCGRAVAACLDVENDRFLSHSYNSRTTTVHVSSVGSYIFHGGATFDMAAKREFSIAAHEPVLTEEVAFFGANGHVVAYDLLNPQTVEVKDRRGKVTTKSELTQLWSLAGNRIHDVPDGDYAAWAKEHPIEVDLKAGNRLYGHQGKSVFALDLKTDGKSATVSWTQTVAGTPATMIAANGKLVVVTKEGGLYCFGDQQSDPGSFTEEQRKLAATNSAWSNKVSQLLKHTKTDQAYCVVLGIGSGSMIDELIDQSELDLIVIEPDAGQVDHFRARYDKAGVYGSRVVILQSDALTAELPAYMAHLIVSESAQAVEQLATNQAWQTIYNLLRPYGGTACFELSETSRGVLAMAIKNGELPKAELSDLGNFSVVTRVGRLPGSADWTHEYGDESNTLMSHDELVKAPLGVLWFGGPAGSGELFYNRHYWGPSMAVIEGRMFLQGPGKLTAVDVYTGRILWQIPVEENPMNDAGRRGNDFEGKIAGHHFLAVEDSVYLVTGRGSCLRLDPATGKTLAELKLPNPDDDWGRIRVHGDLLLTSAFRISEKIGERYGKLPLELVAMNRHTGQVHWTHSAEMSFPVVSVSDDRIYVFDGALENYYTDWKRRGKVPEALDDRFIKAIDIETGKEIWKHRTDVVGTWLSFSTENDVMLLSNRETISGFRGEDGSQLWKIYATGEGFRGHPENLWDKVIVWNDRILDQRGPGKAYDLETGEPIIRSNPITGEPIPWTFTKAGHHCNYAIASPHLMTFRAASAGFCDIDSTNTSRLEGFRSGCRNSLIPANGVLNSPNMAHGCSCGYSLFTSMALAHIPQTEVWSYSALNVEQTDRVKQVGINLGAPGDRQAENGTMWLDYPNVGGSSPVVNVKVAGNDLQYFYKHSAFVEAGDMKWVAASGVEGASSLDVTLSPDATDLHRYTVRLYFLDPGNDDSLQHIFNISMQGETVLEALNVAEAAKGTNRAIVQEFKGVQASTSLKIDLESIMGTTLLSGVEIVSEE